MEGQLVPQREQDSCKHCEHFTNSTNRSVQEIAIIVSWAVWDNLDCLTARNKLDSSTHSLEKQVLVLQLEGFVEAHLRTAHPNTASCCLLRRNETSPSL